MANLVKILFLFCFLFSCDNTECRRNSDCSAKEVCEYQNRCQVKDLDMSIHDGWKSGYLIKDCYCEDGSYIWSNAKHSNTLCESGWMRVDICLDLCCNEDSYFGCYVVGRKLTCE